MNQRLLCFLFALTSLIGQSFAQNRQVSGRVTSASTGNAIGGVSVAVVGTSVATQTDAEGSYTLSVPTNSTISFSSVGFEAQRIPVDGRTVINVVLTDGTEALDEVVITGYARIQKKTFAGASSSVRMEDFSRQTVGSLDAALQAAAPGVSVVGQSGQPGTNAIVRIRGNGSINGGNAPLYILDGMEISAADFASMNSSDFASVDILKDAVSSAIYGSRGANGVIVLTSKKGSQGPIKFNYRSQFGFSNLPKDRLITMNSSQKIDYEMQRGNPYGWSDEEADSLRNVNFRWTDALLQKGKTQEHSIEAAGGGENSTYFGSLSYFDQDGVVKTTGLKRYTARVNLDGKKGSWRFGLNVSGGFSKMNRTVEGDTYTNTPLNAARWSNPYETDKIPGTDLWNQDRGGGPGNLISGQPNGAMELALDYNWRNQIKGLGTSYVEFHFPFLDGLYARTNWGIDYTQNENAIFNDPRTSGAQARNGSLQRNMDRNFRYTGTTSLNYSGKFEDHEITAGIFAEVVKNDYRRFGFTGYGFTNGFNNETGITAGSGTNTNYIPSVFGDGNQAGLLSYFAMANYGYKDKYYLNLVGRRDGSSRFGINRRYANFGSIGATWSISDEEFIKQVPVISNLQLRASYGSNGNAGDAEYPLPLFGRITYAGVSGWSPSEAGNPDLTWEISKTTNVGVNFGLWQNRIFGSVDVYNRETSNLFYNIPVDPASSGFTTILGNSGTMTNSGVEVDLSVDVIRNNDLKWTIGGNFTYNKNRIKSLPQDSLVQGITILAEGHALNSYFLVNYAGVNPENGNAQYYDLDGNIVEGTAYNASYKVIQGTSDAPYFGGVFTSFSYKGFDFAAQASFFIGRKLFNNDMVNLTHPQYYWDNLSVDMLNEWQNPGDITNVPRPGTSGGNAFQQETTRYLENANFWRLRNVTIGYNLPASVLDKAKIRSLRVFVQGQNWLTATKYKNYDPELVTNGAHSGAVYPTMVQTTFGVNIGF
ncbi:SusC/RagA family TonB-linked outer membrane protein [Sphingobacterium suaedae]|uniref:SusC/RagA family TonB-linked outer membrane protein n=1 Tax=Sphingobacterium suaedae TaxID=1686402 RepID=A0ABW5KM53_9SPHI